MANYENGAYTRRAIVDACKQLFYEKGYHETSYADICKAAHVNRSTIYYHFDTKEAMRYEVVWELTVANKRVAEKYCGMPEYHYILAVGMMWYQIRYDEKLRRFYYGGCTDCPAFTGRKDLSYYYTILYERMWGHFLDKKNISELAFATVYGYIMSCMRLMCEHPENYDPMELFLHCSSSSMNILGASPEALDGVWEDIPRFLAQIPEAELCSVHF